MIPDKVVITITAGGIETVVYSGEKEISNRKEKMISSGESKSTQKGDVYDDLHEDYHGLAQEIDEGLSFGPFNVAGALFKIRENNPIE